MAKVEYRIKIGPVDIQGSYDHYAFSALVFTKAGDKELVREELLGRNLTDLMSILDSLHYITPKVMLDGEFIKWDTTVLEWTGSYGFDD